MFINKHSLILIVVLSSQLITGCSYIKSLFPDKERDYQFRTEIPELIIPDDLKAQTFPGNAVSRPSISQASIAPEPVANKSVPKEPEPSEPINSSVANNLESTNEQKEDSSVAVTSQVGSISSLQIDQKPDQAWRLVSRALSRQKVEIIERNIEKGYFYVKYDPYETQVSDVSFWDEINFMFGDDPSHEQEYRISLLETTPQVTVVTIQDNLGKTLSNNMATHLLKLITDGINQDLPVDTPKN